MTTATYKTTVYVYGEEREGIAYELPAEFSEKAKKAWDYLTGAAEIIDYENKLVIVDESGELLPYNKEWHGHRIIGGPRVILDNWKEVELWLESVTDDLGDEMED